MHIPLAFQPPGRLQGWATSRLSLILQYYLLACPGAHTSISKVLPMTSRRPGGLYETSQPLNVGFQIDHVLE